MKNEDKKPTLFLCHPVMVIVYTVVWTVWVAPWSDHWKDARPSDWGARFLFSTF